MCKVEASRLVPFVIPLFFGWTISFKYVHCTLNFFFTGQYLLSTLCTLISSLLKTLFYLFISVPLMSVKCLNFEELEFGRWISIKKTGQLHKLHNKVIPGSDRTSPRSTGRGAFHTPRLCQPHQPSFYRGIKVLFKDTVQRDGSGRN